MILACQPGLWLYVAQRQAAAMITPVGFEMLDRVPSIKQRSVAPAADEEDAMAMHKSLKPAA
jgi:hypothetical protein